MNAFLNCSSLLRAKSIARNAILSALSVLNFRNMQSKSTSQHFSCWSTWADILDWCGDNCMFDVCVGSNLQPWINMPGFLLDKIKIILVLNVRVRVIDAKALFAVFVQLYKANKHVCVVLRFVLLIGSQIAHFNLSWPTEA